MTAPAKACLLLLSVAVVAIALFVLFFDKHNELLGYRFLFRSPEQPHVYSSQLPLSPRLSAKDVYNLKISQSRMTEMLRVFDEICVNHSIEYFVIGGTLLGAVAYQDWIPWDGDVDVEILKSDWSKLVACSRIVPLCVLLQL